MKLLLKILLLLPVFAAQQISVENDFVDLSCPKDYVVDNYLVYYPDNEHHFFKANKFFMCIQESKLF